MRFMVRRLWRTEPFQASFRELMHAQSLSAGPSLRFMALIKWSSVRSSRACPSISWERNTSATPSPPAQREDAPESCASLNAALKTYGSAISRLQFYCSGFFKIQKVKSKECVLLLVPYLPGVSSSQHYLEESRYKKTLDPRPSEMDICRRLHLKC